MKTLISGYFIVFRKQNFCSEHVKFNEKCNILLNTLLKTSLSAIFQHVHFFQYHSFSLFILFPLIQNLILHPVCSSIQIQEVNWNLTDLLNLISNVG